MIDIIKEFLQSHVDKGDFPGGGYALIDESGIIMSGFVGYKSLKPNKVLNQGNEIYDIASLTKVVSTTSLIMKLREEGRLELDGFVTEILPRFRHSSTTIYQLLTHTSGLPADIPNAKKLSSHEEVEEIVYGMDLIYRPGERIVYSDIGFILLGWIIEKISNTSLNQFAKEKIFEPLKMNDTGYTPNIERAAPTEYRDDTVFQGFLQGRVHDEKAFALGGISGHAGLFSTPNDLALFIHAFLLESPILFQKSTFELLFVPREDITDSNGNRSVRALGWDKPLPGGSAGDGLDFLNSICHTGFTGCNIWIDRLRKLGFVLLSNGVHPLREMNRVPFFRNKLANIILSNKGE